MWETPLGYKFRDETLLKIALTRTSFIARQKYLFLLLPFEEFNYPFSQEEHMSNFSRLKFLGTHVLGLVVGQLLFATSKYHDEKTLTRIFATILGSKGAMVECSRALGLPEQLMTRMDGGEIAQKVYAQGSVLFEHMQALFGAIWLDSDRDFAIIKKCFEELALINDTSDKNSYHITVAKYAKFPINFSILQKNLGYTFSDTDLLINALARESARKEKMIESGSSFQIFEFLGDKVLNCVIADWLVRHVKGAAKQLVPIYTQLTSNTGLLLPEIAKDINLGQGLIIGKGEEQQNVRNNLRKLVDHVEAMLGACWLDCECNYVTIYSVIENLIERHVCLEQDNTADTVQVCLKRDKNQFSSFAQFQQNTKVSNNKEELFPPLKNDLNLSSVNSKKQNSNQANVSYAQIATCTSGLNIKNNKINQTIEMPQDKKIKNKKEKKTAQVPANWLNFYKKTDISRPVNANSVNKDKIYINQAKPEVNNMQIFPVLRK
ncbi:MAG: hypothetical protein Tsb005_12860 [Gammaproteobacteria bacterium]